jgi:hypothetical protein
VLALEIEAREHPVVEVEDDRYCGAADSGGRVVREVRVRVGDGRRYRLCRAVPDGEWTVVRIPSRS